MIVGCSGRSQGPRFEVGDIFRKWDDAYRQRYVLSPEQARTMRAIELCRTAALGGHLDVCDNGCGYERPSYNSCRDRHCPKCQSLAGATWMEARSKRTLPVNYFHVVFTLPAELRPIALNNRRRIFDMLFAAASTTLLDLGRDPKRLGATLGITAVLHTWTRSLAFHPHLHTIVTGGGLAPGGDRWVPARGRFLFPVKVLSELFRGKFLAALRDSNDRGELRLAGTAARLDDPRVFQTLLDQMYSKDWVVYAKRPFGGPEHVHRYLSLYTHRVGIANSRLLAVGDDGIRFSTKDGKSVALPPLEFIRRFLLHVLPGAFVKIRHYGLLAAANVNTKLELARALLDAPTPSGDIGVRAIDWVERTLVVTGVDVMSCPRCQTGRLVSLLIAPSTRPPPQAAAPA